MRTDPIRSALFHAQSSAPAVFFIFQQWKSSTIPAAATHCAAALGHMAVSLWHPPSWATHPKIQGQLSHSLSH